MIDAELLVLFDGVFFKIDIKQFFQGVPHFLNALDPGVVNSEPSGVIKYALHRCTGRGQSLQRALKFPSENEVCEVQECDKVKTSLLLPNNTLILISFVCSRPASARSAS